ncbi:hypothetical protein SAMN05428945_1333 [Streptomyces sp. 2224.1]|uniref:hypothetical protein n=1 Tax=unclassified Streptomyces TaxID=2593676 RepID=UPI000886A354|nr:MULTISPECIES: hypothetical protein [unclassified Streptomyces]PBC84047.1 hypothetical protein BX261_4020 [Streptomyces sp. 2321.6]SDR35646.1 hypothetical protein SAMN05216511_3178 [Streptomyces sp. KS_16]SEB84796.1 hypothetical protein SAMN05428945_1333 [Streptomyces sp. 2224.1]SED18074.1 hypothetical protein SAMN05428940_4047 [Streptomyces sp. 2133.1]SNC70128.1 hypothetical protein SAMN06272741_4011 [Streptomyces sp. 2114.4]
MMKARIVTRSVLGLAVGAVAVLTAVGPAQAATSAPDDTHGDVTLTVTGAGVGDLHGGTSLSSDDTHW